MPFLPVLFTLATLLPILLGFGFHIPGRFRDMQFCLVPLLLYIVYCYRHTPFVLMRKHRLWIWSGFGCLFVAAAWSRYLSITLSGEDFSIFDWMMLNTWRGNFMFSPINGFNHFAVHPSWIFLPLVPLHALFMSPLFLLTVGPLVLWLAAWPLWTLCKCKGLSDFDAGIVVLAYLTTPFVGFVVNTGFRIESFLPLGLFTFLLGWEKKHQLGWILGAIFFLSIKEDSGFYLAAFAIAHLFHRDTRRNAIFLLVGSLVITGITLGIVQPFFLQGAAIHEPGYLRFWGHHGATKSAIMMHMISSPGIMLHDIVTSGWWRLYPLLLGLPLLSFPTLLASIPGILLLGTAASCEAMHQYHHYYPLLLACMALFGMAEFLARPTLSFHKKWLARVVLLVFPLFHAGWVSVFVPDKAILSDLQQARVFLEQRYPQVPICTQMIGFPYLGYRLQLQPYTPACMAQPGAVALTVPAKDPHPHVKEYWDSLDGTLVQQGKKRNGFGEVRVYSP